MFLIAEDILNKLICDKCKKCLSVAPVKVYSNKLIYCGRCSKDNDDGVFSLYNIIMKQGLFRCINRYDGCNKLLLYSEVLAHEECCTSQLYRCPNCHLAPEMPSFLLIEHFKVYHRTSILNKSSFSINIKSFSVFQRQYLYMMGDLLFIISLLLMKNQLVLNASHIGNRLLSTEIIQKFIISSSDNTFKKYVTEARPCCVYEVMNLNNGFKVNFITRKCCLYVDFNLDTTKVQKLLTFHVGNSEDLTKDYSEIDNELYLTDDFKKMWSSQYFLDDAGNLVNVKNAIIKCCSFCHNKFKFFSINQSVYKCKCKCCLHSGSFICSQCYLFGIKKCANGKDYELAPEETAVFERVQYFCKWNCGEKCFSWNLREHEYKCTHQKLYKCPVEGCKWTSKLYEIKQHLPSHEDVGVLNSHTLEFSFLKKSRMLVMKNEILIPVSNYFVSLKWKRMFKKYQFFLGIKGCQHKYPIVAIINNGKLNIFDESFTVDFYTNPKLLIIVKDLCQKISCVDEPFP